jgi:hypothetical protein
MDDERPDEPEEQVEILDDAPAEAAEESADVVEATEPDEPDAEVPDAPAAGRSSHPAVDEVLRSLERLEDVPVDEHVAAFEQAHDELRRALAEARDHGE